MYCCLNVHCNSTSNKCCPSTLLNANISKNMHVGLNINSWKLLAPLESKGARPQHDTSGLNPSVQHAAKQFSSLTQIYLCEAKYRKEKKIPRELERFCSKHDMRYDPQVEYITFRTYFVTECATRPTWCFR